MTTTIRWSGKALPYEESKKTNWKVGDNCVVQVNYRQHGIIGGWQLWHYPAYILKVNRMTVWLKRYGWNERIKVSKTMIYEP